MPGVVGSMESSLQPSRRELAQGEEHLTPYELHFRFRGVHRVEDVLRRLAQLALEMLEQWRPVADDPAFLVPLRNALFDQLTLLVVDGWILPVDAVVFDAADYGPEEAVLFVVQLLEVFLLVADLHLAHSD
jgi:hypothetical protein